MKSMWVFMVAFVFNSIFLFSGNFCVSAAEQGRVNPCLGDVSKFCGEMQGGGVHVMDCLASHSAELSPECKSAVERLKVTREVFIKDCGQDISKFCNGVKPGGGRLFQCLKGHSSELSSSCLLRMKGGEGSPVGGVPQGR